MKRYDVIIVGGGIVGLSCGLNLVRNNFNVLIVDQNEINAPDADTIPKQVSAINTASQSFLKEMKVWAKIQKDKLTPFYKMEIWDNTLTNLNFFSHELSMSHLGIIVENKIIKKVLREEFIENNGILEIGVVQNIKSINNSIICCVNNSPITSKLLIGADGKRSIVANTFNFKYERKFYGQKSITTTFKTQFSHHNIAYQKFLKYGVLALLPLHQPNLVALIYSIDISHYDKIIKLNKINFTHHIKKLTNNKFGEFMLLRNIDSFNLSESNLKKYYKDNVVLIGDAAHTLHPLAGQGLNLGFSDAKYLSKLLIKEKLCNRNFSHSSILARFERNRKIQNNIMLEFVSFMKKFFCNDNKLLTLFRKSALYTINKSRILKYFFVYQANKH